MPGVKSSSSLKHTAYCKFRHAYGNHLLTLIDGNENDGGSTLHQNALRSEIVLKAN